MIPLITTVFLASLLGSLHCAGMCGAFVLFATAPAQGDPPRRTRDRASLLAAYNLGRLATYAALGAIAGSLGAAFDLAGSLAGVQRLAATLAGAFMLAFGAAAIARIAGARVPRLPVPGVMQDLLMRAHRAAANRPPLARAAATGLVTTLLPCGWLYAFVVTAAGTADPLLGALTMAAFWAGTLPILVSLGAGAQRLAGPLGRRFPMVSAAAITLVGLFTVLTRAGAEVSAPRPAGATPAALTEHVHTLDAEESSCCAPRD